MVMPTESQTENLIQEVQSEAPIEEPTQDAPVEDTEVPVAPTEGQQESPAQGQLPLEEQPAPIEQPVQPVQEDPNIKAQIEELHRIRQENAQKEWEQQIVKEAQQVRNRAVQRGIDPETATELARQHWSGKKQLRDQQSQSYDLIRNIEGRNNATLHFLEKQGLVDKQMIEDFQTLSQFTSPQDMEREAIRMSETRQLRKRVAELQQNQVQPQTFDNSQGAAEPTSNQDRLLQEYIAGYKTEAHQAAARRAANGPMG